MTKETSIASIELGETLLVDWQADPPVSEEQSVQSIAGFFLLLVPPLHL